MTDIIIELCTACLPPGNAPQERDTSWSTLTTQLRIPTPFRVSYRGTTESGDYCRVQTGGQTARGT